MDNNTQLEYKSAFRVVLDSFLSAIKHLFGNIKNFRNYYMFMLVQFFSSLFVPLTPFAVKANYAVSSKILNNEDYEIMMEYKGITCIKRYFKYFLLGAVKGALVLGVIIATLLIFAPIILLLGFESEVLPFVGILGAGVLVFAVLVSLPLIYHADYVYCKEKIELVEIVKKSMDEGKAKSGEIILSSIFSSILTSLLMIVPALFITGFFEEDELILLALGVLFTLVILPIMDLTNRLVQIRLIKQTRKEKK